MKGIDGMIRLNRMRLDEARKALAEAEAAVDACDAALDALAQEVAREQIIAEDQDAARAYGAFAQAAIRRRVLLMDQRRKAVTLADDRRAVVADAFRELKKFELVAEREAARRKAERDRQEQAALDAVALQRFGTD